MKPELRCIGLLLALPLALAGCGKSNDGAGATAAGEVLPGSVSDAMLPLDTVRSQPPLAPMAEESGEKKERKPASPGGGQPSEAASEPTPEAPADAAPASAEPVAE